MSPEGSKQFAGNSPTIVDSLEDILRPQQDLDLPDLLLADINAEHETSAQAGGNVEANDCGQPPHAIQDLHHIGNRTTDLGDDVSETELDSRSIDAYAIANAQHQVPYVDRNTRPTAVEQIRAVLGDDDAKDDEECVGTFLNGQDKSTVNEVTIKKEPADWGSYSLIGKPGGIIDLSDDEDVQEIPRSDMPMPNYRFSTTMQDGTIEILDIDEEIIVFDDGTTSVAVKKEDQDVEMLGATTNPINMHEDLHPGDQSPETAPRLGKSFLKPKKPRPVLSSAQKAQMRMAQQMYAQRKFGTAVKIGAGSIFRVPQTSFPDPTSTEDSFVWMSNTVIPEDKPATDFRALKRSYQVKRKTRKNTLEDDVEFKKAQMEETKRLRLLAIETADSESSDEAEESDEGLFLPDIGPRRSKQGAAPAQVDDEDDEDIDARVKRVLTGQAPAKVSKAKEAASNTELSTRRSRAKALARELRFNMMAGIEAHLLKDQFRMEAQAAKRAEAEAAEQGCSKSNKRKKTKAADFSAKRTKNGRVSNVTSLLTSNIYDDSNANLNKQSLPVVEEKKKKEFLSSLVAKLPIADQKQANTDRIDIIRASKILAKYKVVPDGKGNWAFKGLKSSLYHYQVQGAAAMKSRETGAQEPFGGILADEMGLGKTVQMIATMMANPQVDPNDVKCTLIVCTPALMIQWESELEKHAEGKTFGRIARHHGSRRFFGKGAEEEMQRADVILTTYGEVIRSYPTCVVPKELKSAADQELWWSRKWEGERDLLHRAQFYRVVLDEAQVIKNHMSQTSIACRALMAKHRWAISGTPIQNRLDELFPYFKLLRVQHTGSMAVFRQNFCLKDDEVCNKRLHSMLDGMMIRRTHQDMLLGAPLVKLPKNTQETIRLKFNKVERQVYEAIRMRCVRNINAMVREHGLEDKTKLVIMMFQRLRQMVSHIFIAQEVIEKEFEMFDIEYMWETILTQYPDHTESEEAMLRSLKNMIDRKGTAPPEQRSSGLQFTEPRDRPEPKTAKKKAGSLLHRFGAFLKDLKKQSKWSELRDYSLCHSCGQPPDDPMVISCLHLYCKDCLNNLAYDASHRDLDQTECGKCHKVFTESASCEGLKELEVRDLSASIFQDGKDKEAAPRKAFKLTTEYADGDDGLILSSKAIAVKNQLAKWIAKDPTCKIIVFTEWLLVMHVIGRVCSMQGWKCCHYNGSMSHAKRDEALSAFRKEDGGHSNVQIMIASLKCGGTGLNLTAASKVICVDLWYNSCVEQQAFARVFRIGQQQETYITRCIVENTVDEQLLEMQERKKEVISNAMDDRSIMANLTLPELLRLFGPVAYDANSKPFIMVDDEAEMQGLVPPVTVVDE